MKHQAMILLLLALCLLAVQVLARQIPFEEPRESRIEYDNQVLATISAQLEGLPLDDIRAKEGLILERSMAEIQAAIRQGQLSYAQLTAFYLDRISRYDKGDKGLNAVITINPQAMAIASKLDQSRALAPSPVYGMPILLKDNINTRDMPTSAGTHALRDFLPAQDAPVVQALLANHAIILGKVNLSELANYMDYFMPSGYSARLGQTHNPFDPLVLSPSGSSSGSAVAVAVNFCAASLGTETTGSIISPARMQSLVGFKPTKDLISTEGVVPLSATMDTVGPLAKTVADAALLFNACLSDPAGEIHLGPQGLAGKRIGVFQMEDSQQLTEALQGMGAVPVLLEASLDAFDNSQIIRQEFAADFAAYAKAWGTPVRSLQELMAYNRQDMNRRARYDQGLLADAAGLSSPDRALISQMVEKTTGFIASLMAEHRLDAFAAVGEEVVILPCLAGYPEVTVPFGRYDNGEPRGVTFFAKAHEDQLLMNMALAFEQGSQLRQIPEKYKTAETQ